jgi:hypothetical protein
MGEIKIYWKRARQPSDMICRFMKEYNTLVKRNTPVPAPQVAEWVWHPLSLKIVTEQNGFFQILINKQMHEYK